MTIQTQQEKLHFGTDVNQLLKLVVNALYSNKEIFLRELISNSSDAADKLRFESLEDSALFENDSALKIYVEFDEKVNTIMVKDNGIGMSREEVIAHIGTIAKSGTQEFLDALSGDQVKDAQLIGQFGVGFYSAFVVADKIIVKTRRAGLTKEHGVYWESEGKSDYVIKNIEKISRGTEIILHLKKSEKEFLDGFRLRNIIQKYSDHIAIPIMMKKTVLPGEKEKKETDEFEQVNRATALWTLPKSKIKDEEYKELYKHVAHDFEDPLLWIHNKVEGKQEYTTLLYLPARAPFDLWQREHRHGLKLYVKRVFIMDNAEQFLPNYLRFVKGIVDSSDLPLNISREILQSNPLVDQIRSGVVKRVLGMLEEMAKNDVEKYTAFWAEFGPVLKEGPAEDFSNKESVAKLLRFTSTHNDSEKQTVSLQDYISRMQKDQKKIYYITAENFLAAKHSPYLEFFKEKGIEVLLLSDRIDEWLMMHLTEFENKAFQSVAKGELDINNMESDDVKVAREKEKKTFDSMLVQIKKILGERVKDTRMTYRLTNSPACIVADESDINMNMQRILKAMGQSVPDVKPIFELNPKHAIVKRLHDEKDDARFAEWVNVLFDQSVLAEGGQLKDPATFVANLNKLLIELAG